LPVSSPWPSGDQTICEMPWTAQSGKISASGACQSIEYCGWEETNRSGRPMSMPADIWPQTLVAST